MTVGSKDFLPLRRREVIYRVSMFAGSFPGFTYNGIAPHFIWISLLPLNIARRTCFFVSIVVAMTIGLYFFWIGFSPELACFCYMSFIVEVIDMFFN